MPSARQAPRRELDNGRWVPGGTVPAPATLRGPPTVGAHLSLQLGPGLRVGGGRGAPAPALAAALPDGLVLIPDLVAAAGPAARPAARGGLPALGPLAPPLPVLLVALAQPPQLLLPLAPPPGLQLPAPLLVPPLPLADAVHLVAVAGGAGASGPGLVRPPPPAPGPSRRPPRAGAHLSLLELLGGRSGFGFRPRAFGGGFSAAGREGHVSRTVPRARPARGAGAAGGGPGARGGRAAPLPGFLPRGGFFTDTSESEEEEEEEDAEEDAGLGTATGSPLAPSDSPLESEAEADGAFWGQPAKAGIRIPCPKRPTAPTRKNPPPQTGHANHRYPDVAAATRLLAGSQGAGRGPHTAPTPAAE